MVKKDNGSLSLSDKVTGLKEESWGHHQPVCFVRLQALKTPNNLDYKFSLSYLEIRSAPRYLRCPTEHWLLFT